MAGLDDTRRVARLAARQEGNVTLAQLRAAGLSDWDIERRIEEGWLIRRHREVYALGHVPRSRLSRWWAGALALGHAAVLSHRAAGAFWEIVRGAVPTELTLPTSAGFAHRDGLLVHRASLPPEHVERVRGLPVTTLVRTILDLAAVLDRRPLGNAFEQAQVHHDLSPDAVAVEVIARRGYRGTGKLRHVLRGAVDAAGVRSVLELRFLQLCDDARVPRPLVNEKIDVWTPDFWWPDRRLVVETDGYDFHRTAAAKRRDQRKDEALRALGLTVIRLTWRDVHDRRGEVMAMVRSSVAGPWDEQG